MNWEMNQQQELTLEGYRNLSFWNKHDAQAVLSFDKIFLPASVGASALSLASDASKFIFVYPGIVLLLSIWFSLSLRYRERIHQRFDVMKQIEINSGFGAHSLLDDDAMITPRDQTSRTLFFGVALIINTGMLLYQVGISYFC